jgi:putative FmdB family regulatory protein
MPIYEYNCAKCNNTFAILQRVGTTEKETECPGCGSKDVKKNISAFSFSGGGCFPSSHSHPHFGGGGGG